MNANEQKDRKGLVLRHIAHIETAFPEKFGIPRQSGLVPQLRGRIVFGPPYRVREAFRGLEDFSHLWLIWEFSQARRESWSPTVRPPRLGGNTRMGVFATRSPFRPNPLGLSCVELDSIDWDAPDGPALWVRGADLLDGTPIYDIKPYLPYADSRPDAKGGFAPAAPEPLAVDLPEELLAGWPPETLEALRAVLAEDPRPSYQEDPDRVYGMAFGSWNVKFTVREGTLTVHTILPRKN